MVYSFTVLRLDWKVAPQNSALPLRHRIVQLSSGSCPKSGAAFFVEGVPIVGSVLGSVLKSSDLEKLAFEAQANVLRP